MPQCIDTNFKIYIRYSRGIFTDKWITEWSTKLLTFLKCIKMPDSDHLLWFWIDNDNVNSTSSLVNSLCHDAITQTTKINKVILGGSLFLLLLILPCCIILHTICPKYFNVLCWTTENRCLFQLRWDKSDKINERTKILTICQIRNNIHMCYDLNSQLLTSFLTNAASRTKN